MHRLIVLSSRHVGENNVQLGHVGIRIRIQISLPPNFLTLARPLLVPFSRHSLTEGSELSGGGAVFKEPQAVRPQVQLRAAREISPMVLPSRQYCSCKNRVKFSPTGCQAGSGSSSTRSGRSGKGNHSFLETRGFRGTWRGTRGPERERVGIQRVEPEGEDSVTQGAGLGREGK